MNRFEKFIIYLLFPILIIDALNGYLIRNYSLDLSLSQVYKMLIILLLIPAILRDRIYNLYFLLILSSYSLIIFFHVPFFKKANYLIADVLIVTKMVFPLFVFVFIKNYFKRYDNEKIFNHIKKIFVFSYLVIVINIFFSLLGIGYSITDNFGGLGSIGFFKSGNALSSTFLIISAFLFYVLWETKKKVFYYLLFGVITIFFSILLQTKTSIIGTFIFLIGIPVLHDFKKILNLRVSRKFLVIASVFLIIFFISINLIILLDLGIVKKITFFYQNYGLLFTVMTGRNVFLEIGMRILTETYNIRDWFFGRGFIEIQQAIGDYYSKDRIVEMDFFDILLSYGITGVLLSYSIWFLFLFISFKKISSNKMSRLVFSINVILLSISFLAGHIMFGGLISPFVGLLNALVYYQKPIGVSQDCENTANK